MIECDDYAAILSTASAFMDVRAPCEFQQGALDSAINLPLLLDDERAQVGTCYKQQGQQAAIALGTKLVSGQTKAQRIAKWIAFCQQYPNGYLYCLRGGLRSHIVQSWLKAEGVEYPLVVGGYKALRHYLNTQLDEAVTRPMLIVAGQTGCGKTPLLAGFHSAIDLEGIAKHRGSSFGRLLEGQSSQASFELRLAHTFFNKMVEKDIGVWILEDENHSIGSNHLPPKLYYAMQDAPIAVINEPFEKRLARIKQEYVVSMHHQFQRAYGDELGWQAFCDYLQQGLYAIRKRLGGLRYHQLSQSLTLALQEYAVSQDTHCHESWLTPLIVEYYDPMYDYQLGKKSARIIYQGDYLQVSEFLREYHYPVRQQ